MSVPPAVVRELEQRFGGVELLGAVAGGCIHSGQHIRAGGDDLFLKFGRDTGPGFFAAEAEGLRQLRASTDLTVPEVLESRDRVEREWGWIVMEWLEPGRRSPGFSQRLARGLGALHARREGPWGWEREGFIGTLAQANQPEANWSAFWRLRRLEPQLALAREAGRLPGRGREWEMLLDRLPALLAPGEVDGPSLLHGDLWGGNILATASGGAALIDPAVYRGHREVDLAMGDLFGGLDREFHEAYASLRPLQPGYHEVRRGIYQLYYLLVHVNLFGEGYVARTAATLRSVLSAV